MTTSDAEQDDLCGAARAVLQRAHAPYSGVRVGAAVLGERVHLGVNVENASFGATVCAERSALAAAITAGDTRIRAIAIAVDSDAAEPIEPLPCGICRQWMVELAPDADIILCRDDGLLKVFTIAELLPHPFTIDPA